MFTKNPVAPRALIPVISIISIPVFHVTAHACGGCLDMRIMNGTPLLPLWILFLIVWSFCSASVRAGATHPTDNRKRGAKFAGSILKGIGIYILLALGLNGSTLAPFFVLFFVWMGIIIYDCFINQTYRKAMSSWWRNTNIGFLGIAISIIGFYFVGFLVTGNKPTFTRAPERAYYSRCVEALTAIKMAEEMYITDYGYYTDKWDHLAPNMIAGCTKKDGSDCAGQVYERISNSCDNATLELVGEEPYKKYNYKIKGTAKDRLNCNICVTPAGYWPESYSYTDCKKEEPTCP